MRRSHSWIALAVGALLGCGDDNPTNNDSADNQANQAYIDMIVPHHELATMMADEAMAKAVHPGLVTLAQRAKDDQVGEIAVFKSERARLFGSDVTPPTPLMQPIPAGPVFDSIWLEQFIQHHQTAISNSLFALQGQLSGGDLTPIVDSLARHTIDEQVREESEMRDSIAAWYGEPQP